MASKYLNGNRKDFRSACSESIALQIRVGFFLVGKRNF
jgi:hypothetical protein